MANPPLSDGRLTSLTSLTTPITGGEVMYIVSPGNAAQGVSYQVTTQILGSYFASFIFLQPTIITSGSSYNSVSTDSRILVNKTVGSATSILLLPSASYSLPVLVKDLKGDAGTNPITVTFSGSQTIDGLSEIIINNNYGYLWFNPLSTGGWYDAAF